MATIYEPSNIRQKPDDGAAVVPNVEITPGLRMHLHADGITFGYVDSRFPDIAQIITYGQAREMMLNAAAEYAERKSKRRSIKRRNGKEPC